MTTSFQSSNRAPDFRVGYVVKRYPRFSETFIVNEILAHEAAGRMVEIFSLHPPNDAHFQDLLSRVRAPVTYLPGEGARAAELWAALEAEGRARPDFWPLLGDAAGAGAREVFQAVALAGLARKRGIRHLHAHFASAAASVARLAAKFIGGRYSITAHAKDIFHESVRVEDLRRKVADAAAVVTVSDYNAAHLRRAIGADASKVLRIYNGMHLDRFSFESPRQRNPRVAAVGRLVEKKGFGVLLEALALLKREGVDCACDIVGTGDQEAALREQARRLGLGERARFWGALPQGEVIRIVREASALAAPCVVGTDGNADGMPTVLLEAMALGTPCVSTDVTGIPELVRDGETGLLTGQKDSCGLAAALRRLLEDADLRCKLGRAARTLIEEQFEIRTNAAKLFRLFEEAARGEFGGRNGWEPAEAGERRPGP